MRNAVMDTTAEDNQATPVGDRTRSGSVAARCGERLLIADFYYAQPLSGLIGASLGMPGESNGLLVTPAADQLRLRLADDRAVGNFNENRWLVLCSSDLRHSACWRPPCSFKPYRFWASYFLSARQRPPCNSSFPMPQTWQAVHEDRYPLIIADL
jgi:hypothetical protein